MDDKKRERWSGLYNNNNDDDDDDYNSDDDDSGHSRSLNWGQCYKEIYS
jgi:hypothetical protein